MSILELTAIASISLFALYTVWGLAAYTSHDRRHRQALRGVLRRHPDLADASDERLDELVENERLYALARRDIADLERNR